jgi:iron complex outermembrane receptor protein
VLARMPAHRAYASLMLALIVHAPLVAQAPLSPFELSIEELGQVRVTTVSRRPEEQRLAAASVFVITAEDIRRSGVTSIPEALRLAPGVEVARNGASDWTISIRGFNSDLSNKLLVLIDGRSVYSPLFAGVFWDAQDTLLADIERIEVVSGPGGTLWGANAVNGVINIITRAAADTRGSFAELAAGNEDELIGGFRHGWTIGETMSARAYVRHIERDAAQFGNGAAAADDWRTSRAGFALDWQPNSADRINLRADAYVARLGSLILPAFERGILPGPRVPGTTALDGHDVVLDWRRTIAEDAGFTLLAYYDHTDRQIPGSFNEARDTFDVAFQYDLRNRGRHDLQWGSELRSTKDDIGNTLFATFLPTRRRDDTLSTFIQDRIALRDERLYLTIGAKLEHNNYTGREQQPNVRLTWFPSDRHTVWSAVSRAVRVPARLNTDLELFAPIGPLNGLPFFFNARGSSAFESEEVVAYEAGYRLRASARLTVDVALFDSYYDDLQTQEAGAFTVVPGPPQYLVLPATLANGMEGEVYGGTVAVTWQPLTRWRMQLNYAHLEMDLALKPGSADNGARNVAGNSPRNQLAVRSYLDLPGAFSLYTSVRYVADLPGPRVPSYTAVDWGLEWRQSGTARPLRAALTVQNANDARHLEFGGDVYVERGAVLRLERRF